MSQRQSATFEIRGRTYKVVVLDEAEVDTDPTLLVFRGIEEEAVATIHLDPKAPCGLFGHFGLRTLEPGHIVARDYTEDNE